jgi:glycerate-2-kinase
MEHIIKNFDRLATSGLRKVALNIAEAGLFAIDTKAAVGRVIDYNQKKQILSVAGKKYPLKNFERVMAIGFGKASLDAVTELQSVLGTAITCGYVIDLKQGSLGNITCRVGTHPHPSKVNIEATRELLAMLGECTEKDLVICAVSGGGSALLCYPNEMSCEAETSIIKALTAGGATIQELNTVRKHISKVKGGQLAKLMHPATIINLIFSDVPGDDLSMVASGPTVPDATTMKDAAAILDKYNVLQTCQMPACKLVETPKDNKYFQNVQNVLVVSAKQALLAMKNRAEDLGFDVKIFGENFQGIARELGPQIVAANNQRHQCLLGAGESTVHIVGKGTGGRNQEMALSVLMSIAENQVLACVASDGHDNTDAAGAIVDVGVKTRAKVLGLNFRAYLENNDSYNFFEQTGDLLMTGPTEANVADFFVCLKN